jgi:hypothetical protein
VGGLIYRAGVAHRLGHGIGEQKKQERRKSMHIGTLIGARMYPPCFEFFFKKKRISLHKRKKTGKQ